MISLAIIIGLVAGIVGGMFGISGTIIIITALSYFKMVPDQHTAAGTTLFIVLPPVYFMAVYHYYKNKQIDFSLAFWIMGFFIIGAGIGAVGADKLSDKQLKLYVSILFFILGIISLITYMRINDDVTKPHMNFMSRAARSI